MKQQPRSSAEVDRMLLVMIRSELGCTRYSGTDDAIIRRLAEQGEAAQADHPPKYDVRRVERDHVGVNVFRAGSTAQDLLTAFTAYLQREPMPERYRVLVNVATPDRCDIRICWFEDKFHAMSIQRAGSTGFDFVIIGLPFRVADWFSERAIGRASYFEAEDWSGARSLGAHVPW